MPCLKKITAHLTTLIENTWEIESDNLTKIENAMLGSNFLESYKNHLLICHDVGPWPPVLGVPACPPAHHEHRYFCRCLVFIQSPDVLSILLPIHVVQIVHGFEVGLEGVGKLTVSKPFEGVLSSSGCGKNTIRRHNDHTEIVWLDNWWDTVEPSL